MRVTHLALENYRNYANVDVSLPGGVIALVGDNGQGKTNLIEAVEFLSASSSHRTSDLSQLVRRGFTQGVVRAQLAAGARELVLAIEINNHSPNRAQVNGKVARFSDVAKFLNAVLFSPQDVNLIHGDPENRRRFIDAVVKDIVPSSIKTFADYERTIKHRNALLKSGRANPKVLASLDVWDEKYIQLATNIFEVRVAVLDMIRPLFHRFYESISHTKDPVLIDLDVNRAALSRVTQKPAGPITPDNYAEYVRCYLAECSVLERERAQTLFGPHKDDLAISLNQLDSRGSASHGETWSLALACRLAQSRVISDNSVLGDPVILLDDVYSALDSSRRSALTAEVERFEQCIITCADDADLPKELTFHRIDVTKGMLDANGRD